MCYEGQHTNTEHYDSKPINAQCGSTITHVNFQYYLIHS